MGVAKRKVCQRKRKRTRRNNKFQTKYSRIYAHVSPVKSVELNMAELNGVKKKKWVTVGVTEVLHLDKWKKAGTYIIVGKANDAVETEVELTPAVLARCRNYVFNKPHSEPLDTVLTTIYDSQRTTQAGEDSTGRALFFGETIKKKIRKRKRTQAHTDKHIIITLDGSLENVAAIRKGLGDQRDDFQIVVVEIDPYLAMSHRMKLHQSQSEQYGSDENEHPVICIFGKIEDYIKNLSPTEKFRVVGVYFDYCGGPKMSGKPSKSRELMLQLMSLLPNVILFGVTIAKRQHKGIQEKPYTYFPDPENFNEWRRYNHTRVMCMMFVRARTLTATSSCVDKLQNRTHPALKARKAGCGQNTALPVVVGARVQKRFRQLSPTPYTGVVKTLDQKNNEAHVEWDRDGDGETWERINDELLVIG